MAEPPPAKRARLEESVEADGVRLENNVKAEEPSPSTENKEEPQEEAKKTLVVGEGNSQRPNPKMVLL